MCVNGIVEKQCLQLAGERFHYLAHNEYDRALRRAFWNEIGNRFRRKQEALVSFETALNMIDTYQHQHIGVHEVEIDRIVGSSGRFHDFDLHFVPRRRAYDDRWVNVAQAHYEDVALPPVQLYRIGQDYFVNDGNHRVSVARILGCQSINAQVIEIA